VTNRTFIFAIVLTCAPIAAFAATFVGNIVTITAKPNTATPYQNQPIQYTVTCVVRGNISDLSFNDFSGSSAIVEHQGKPDIYDRVENGVRVKVAEFHYVITPLQPGKVIIPPVVLKGKVEAQDLAALVNPFGKGFTFSAGMQQVMSFISASGGEPFSVASNETVLDVKPPAVAMAPWLPLTSLKIKEDMDLSRSTEIGVPLTRKITLLADGATGDQLPDLELQQNHRNFKVYADKPTWGEDFDKKGGVISGWRKESYSLVPQKAGRLVMPSIRVSWWDIVGNRVATAELPERIVNVLPASDAQRSPIVGTGTPAQSPPIQKVLRFGSSLYKSMGVLAAVLLLAVLGGISTWKKINRGRVGDRAGGGAANGGSRKQAARLAAYEALEHARTAEELKHVLLAYAHERLGVSRNGPLETISSALPKQCTQEEKDSFEAAIRALSAALYAGEKVDLEDTKKRFWRFAAALKGQANDKRSARERLPSLNPT
jgi:hypothetical protein